MLTVLALKNPGECCVDRVRSQKPLVDRVLTVLALKNCSCSLSKTRVVLTVFALKNLSKVDSVFQGRLHVFFQGRLGNLVF